MILFLKKKATQLMPTNDDSSNSNKNHKSAVSEREFIKGNWIAEIRLYKFNNNSSNEF